MESSAGAAPDTEQQKEVKSSDEAEDKQGEPAAEEETESTASSSTPSAAIGQQHQRQPQLDDSFAQFLAAISSPPVSLTALSSKPSENK